MKTNSFKDRLFHRLIYLPPLVLVVFVLFRNFWRWSVFCHNNYDLGIFIEMFQKNAQWILNPYIHVRQIGQFNDHWTWALSFLSPLNHILPAHAALFLIEALSFLVPIVFLIWRYHKGELSETTLLVLSGFIYFNRDLFEAGYFPVHPAAWGIGFLLIWGYLAGREDWSSSDSLSKRFQYSVFILFTLITLMDEQYAFTGFTFGLGIILFANKSKKAFGLFMTLYGVFQILLVGPGRRLLFGPLMPYYKLRIATSFEGFMQHYHLSLDSFKTLFENLVVLIPFIFLLKILSKTQILSRWRSVLIVLALFGPLILGRILTGSFGFHYSIVVVAFWVSVFVALSQLKIEVSRKFAVLSLCFFAWVSIGKTKKAFTAPLFLDNLTCVRRGVTQDEFKARTKMLNESLDRMASEIGDGTVNILASGNLGPNLLVRFPKANIFQFSLYQVRSAEHFDWVFLERNQFGEQIYSTGQIAEDAVTQIKQLPGIEVIYETPSLFLARGHVPVSSVDQFFTPQVEHE